MQANLPQAPGDPSQAKPDFEILNESDPRSLINLVPPKLKLAIENTPDWYLEMDEQALLKSFKAHNGYEPTFTDHRIRISFWAEYERAQRLGISLHMPNVYGGVCSKSYYLRNFLEDKQRVAWLLCPPAEYTQIMNEALIYGVGQLRDLLATPHKFVNSRGVETVDAKLAAVKVEIVKMFDTRLKGAVVQKTQNMHLHASTKAHEPDNKSQMPETLDEIEKKILALEQEISKRQTPHAPKAPPGVIDVTHREVVDVESSE